MSQELFNRFRGAAARDFTYTEVIDAAAAILLNAVAQAHDRLPEAEERVNHVADAIKDTLANTRYKPDGSRRTVVGVNQDITKWLLAEGALTPRDLGPTP